MNNEQMSPLKKLLFVSLFLLFVFYPQATHAIATAQSNSVPPALDHVSLELWPDYDQEALLVLISGVLPETTPLPATITLPLPPEASINAVAYVDAANGALLNLDHDVNGNTLTFVTPSLGFRVEYYQPYSIPTGTEREIRFAWTPPTAVSQIVTSIQQPLAAEAFTLAPPADQIQQLDTGLRYHLYNPRPLTAGQPLFIELSYDLPDNQLTQPLAQNSTPHDTSDQSLTPTSSGDDFWLPDWVLFGGALALLLVAFFFLGSAWRDRQKQAVSVPAKPKRKASSKGGFCGVCGTAVSATDKFCPQCGTSM